MSGRAPCFSIVLPTHNRADVLRIAIQSALWQTAGDFELFVVGDGCTDSTADVVAAFRDPRIRWFDLPKAPGVGYASRNVALREAHGRYVAYLAHDDIWFPDHLASLGALLDDTGAEFAYSRGLAVGLDGAITPYWYNLGLRAHQEALARGESEITMATVVHTRSCLEKYGYWDETLKRSGDKPTWYRFTAGSRFQKTAFLPMPTSLHFLANWRNTRSHRIQTGLAKRLTGDFPGSLVDGRLRLPLEDGLLQQEAAWNALSADPRRIRDIRDAVVQVQDALLWKSRTPPGQLGLRAGAWMAGAADRVMRAVLWMTSAERRRVSSDLGARMRAIRETELEKHKAEGE